MCPISDNMKQMIMTVLGMNEAGSNHSSTPDPKKDDTLVQKLMEGSMVITAQDENAAKAQNSNLTSGETTT